MHGGKDYLHLDEYTIAQALKAKGYATGMWGKWHCGNAEGYHPWQRGFDEALSLQLYKHERATGIMNGQEKQTDAWADTWIVDHAIDFIERHNEGPFFAYLPTMTPHTPLAAPEERITAVMERGISRPLATLYAMVELLDKELGRLFAAVERFGLKDNTVILFMSDNGPAINVGILSDEDRSIRSHTGLRGWKGDIWENGTRSPLFISWPAKIKAGVSETPVDGVDIYPTLLALAKASHPKEAAPIDGLSLAPLLRGEITALPERSLFNYANPGWPPSQAPYNPDGIHNEYHPLTREAVLSQEAEKQVLSVRNGDKKLLLNPDINQAEFVAPEMVLIDLRTDPFEMKNRACEEPETTKRLKGELVKWFNEVKKEPHAFGGPTYILSTETSSVFAATGVREIRGNLQNTVRWLRGWSKAGNQAAYEIEYRGESKREYELTLLFAQEVPETFGMKAMIEEENYMLTKVSTKEIRGRIIFKAGKHRLRLMQTAAPEGGADSSLLSLRFSPV